jgi:gliding motility-associated-like protein
MKKIIFLMSFLLLGFCGYSQTGLDTEGFEGAFPPEGWGIYQNEFGTRSQWSKSILNNVTQPPYQGNHAAFIDRENVPNGIPQDWLTTPQVTLPESAQVRFFSRVTISQDQGNVYELRVSTSDNQSDLSSYELVQTWNETQVNPGFPNYSELVVDLPAKYAAGQKVWVALVMYTQLNGDRWLVDNFSIVQKCLAPLNPTSSDYTTTSANLSWDNPSNATEWQIEVVQANANFTGTNLDTYSGALPYLKTGLQQATNYKYRVRAICAGGVPSDWSETHNFSTRFGAPVNDECANAVVVPVNPLQFCNQVLSGTLREATRSTQGNTCVGAADDDVWFQFTATNTTHIISLANVQGSTNDLVHVVYSGECGALTSVRCSDPESSTIANLVIGQTYKVRVYSKAATAQNVTFDICVTTPPPPPVNDECANAIALTVNSTPLCNSQTAGIVYSATASPETNTCVVGNDDDDVWFQFVATNTNQIITLSDVTGSSTDMVFAVYQGNQCGTNLNYLFCSDPDSNLYRQYIVGETYKVRVYTKAGTPHTTTFNICVTTPPPPPANDNCATPTVLPVNADLTCTQSVSGSVYSATRSSEALVLPCGGSADDDVWFQFTATSTKHIITLSNVAGSNLNLTHVLYEGNDCGTMRQLYCSDLDTSVAGNLVVGRTYKVRIFTFVGTPDQTTSFDVCITTPPPPPANDNCSAATLVTVNPGVQCTTKVSGTVESATPSAETNVCGGNDDDDVWFEFIATNAKHTITLSNITGSSKDLSVVLYQGSNCGALSQLTCVAADASTIFKNNYIIGQTYKIRVYSASSQPQDTKFDLCITSPPPAPVNDDCATAVVVPVNASGECVRFVSGTVESATASAEANTCGGSDDDDVWFQFTATSSKHLISLNNIQGSATNLYHVLYEGSGCGTLKQLYCSDAENSLAQNLTVGTTYKVRVYTFTANPDQTSTFDICIGTPPVPPVNDNCAAAIVVGVNPALDCVTSVSGTIASATASAEQNTCGGFADDDVWYQFTATSQRHAIVLSNITGSTDNLYHAVYEGDVCNSLKLLYCSDPNDSNSDNFVIGKTYKIRVYSNTNLPGQTSAFNLCILSLPAPININTTTYTVEQLVKDVLIDAPCGQVDNITWKTGNNYGQANGIAYFEKGGSAFNLQSGVVLSTGDVTKAAGPYRGETSDGGWPGDTDLFNYIRDAGIDPEINSYADATVLEFDFVPQKGHIKFDFLFASNEYGRYQCEYSDAFAFFLTDVTDASIPVKNLAVVPGTTTPVSVLTIRDRVNNTGCESVNPQYFDKFYGGQDVLQALAAPISFNGSTVSLVAESDVVPFRKYHIKMVIADRNDFRFDSAVFLSKFDIGQVDFGPDLLVSANTALCEGSTRLLESGLDNTFTIKWFKNGNEIQGETGADYLVKEAGTYSIEASATGSSCIATEEIVIEYYTPILNVITAPKDLGVCDASGIATFDLSQNTTTMLAGLTAADYTVSYHLTAADATANTGALTSPYTNTTAFSQTVYVRIVNNVTKCIATTSFRLLVGNLTPDFTLPANVTVCENTTGEIAITPVNFSLTDADITYTWTLNGQPYAAITSTITVTEAGVYEVTVSNISCETVKSVAVAVVPAQVADAPVDVTACNEYLLPALTNGVYYTGPAGTGNVLNAGTPINKTQIVYVYAASPNAIQCADENSFEVTIVPLPKVSVSGACTGQNYNLEAVFTDDIYNVDNVTFSWTDSSGTVIGTDATVRVTTIGDYQLEVFVDGVDCSTIVSYKVDNTLCEIQRGISPGDSNDNNDFDLNGLGVKKITIFNRYGKEVYQFNGAYTNQWHGQTNSGDELPTGTYFYMFERTSGESKTGWIYINRQN